MPDPPKSYSKKLLGRLRANLCCWAIFCGLLSQLFLSSAHADVTAVQVEASIRRGVEYLKGKQRRDGGWEEYMRHSCGLSALCTLALANAGVTADDPAMQRAIGYLRKIKAEDTYSVALQTLALCQIGAVADLPLIRTNVQWLEKQQVGTGGWSYRAGLPGPGDPSNSQFALLALAAAEERGVSVSPGTFQLAAKYWSSLQNIGGGWAYSGDLNVTGSMTCAGVASTIICRGRLADIESRVRGDTIDCCGVSTEDDIIERGLQWLGDHFSARANPGATGIAKNTFYYLYALERVGRLSGRRFIGGRDWYREGAEFLVGAQDQFQGFWVSGGAIENNRFIATSFALLFLSKGKRQVAIGQLDHAATESGTIRPDGLRQLVRHLQRDWGRDLTWQTATLQGATVGDLLQTPVLIVSGNAAPRFTVSQRQLLKDYVDQGGFLVFEANAGDGCGSAEAFEKWVANFCQTTMGTPLERLPPDHPIWFAQRRVNPEDLGDRFWVYGVQACCRTGIVYVPHSLSCRWEFLDPVARWSPPEAVRDQLLAAVALGENFVAYATGRDLKDKLELRSVMEQETTERAGERGVITLGRLGLDAGGLEAQRAIPNLARYLEHFTSVRVTTDSPTVAIDSEAMSSYGLLWLHGRRGFRFTVDQRAAIKEYLEGGGILLVDAICGDPAFQESFRDQMLDLFPAAPLKPLAVDHPLLTAAYGGFDLSAVTLRQPQTGPSGTVVIEKRRVPAMIEGITIDDRLVVIFSPYDLSCALESQSSIQCPGYATEDAARVGINMVLFSLLQ